jgi:ABC-2 type transport system ATP-binding protein
MRSKIDLAADDGARCLDLGWAAWTAPPSSQPKVSPKRYAGGVLAVDSVEKSERRGEVYGFLGPNGAGKTTTLRMLVGLIRPTSGTLTVAGHAPGEPAGLAKIGSLIESPGFYPYLSGRENLMVVADLAGVDHRRVDEVLDLVELTSRAWRKFGTYSTGMKQRLGVAAALLKDPELLILDEPQRSRPAGHGRDAQADKGHGAGRPQRAPVEPLARRGRADLRSGRRDHNGRLVQQSTVPDLLGEEGVLVRAQPIDQAVDLLSRMFGPDATGASNGMLA